VSTKLDIFNKTQLKTNIPDIRPGDVVRIHQRVKEKDKERIQVFEGLVIAKKHGKALNGTFTVRKISLGVGIERVFPFHCPTIEKIEIVKRSKVRRAKLYYMRERRGKKARMKTKELLGVEWEAEKTPSQKSSEENSGSVKTEEKESKEKIEKSSSTSKEARDNEKSSESPKEKEGERKTKEEKDDKKEK